MSVDVTESASEVEEPEVHGVESIVVAKLRIAKWVRQKGVDSAHVASLAELDGDWSPIIVWGENHLVIDGAHRVAAAKHLGHATIRATRFFGNSEDAFVEAVRRNVRHGLPLTMADRTRAVNRILLDHPEWSDRRIAEVCAVSAKTVARVRSDCGKDPTAALPQLDMRLGRDGRMRPTDSASVRARIREALREDPDGSLRAIAARASASPETVRTVRRELQASPLRLVGDASGSAAEDGPVGAMAVVCLEDQDSSESSSSQELTCWSHDPALNSRGDGVAFAEWFDRSALGTEWSNYVAAIPLSRIYAVADEARTRADMWLAFAEAVEHRVHKQRS